MYRLLGQVIDDPVRMINAVLSFWRWLVYFESFRNYDIQLKFLKLPFVEKQLLLKHDIAGESVAVQQAVYFCTSNPDS